MTVYTVANSKGGAGKSFTAAHLCDELARRGKRVVLIELDRQGDASRWLGIDDHTPVVAVTADVLAGRASLTQAATSSGIEGVAVACGTLGLGAEFGPNVIERLREAVSEARRGWDDVVIDTAPALNAVTSAALIAADVVVAPCMGNLATRRQVDELDTFVAREVADYRPGASVDFILPLAIAHNETMPRAIEDDLREQYGAKVTPRVRRATSVEWAWSEGSPLTRSAPASGVAFDVRAALDYIISATEGK